ncbi:MAG TPA: zf-HC2 domain-containing protein [Gaiellaceae bacterium]|nr:zf-HC2 domain-containing protein [Gaiellaceae bacterium]
MTRFPRGVLCERARSWAALAPDNELSELERKLLDSHLERCAGCSSFAERVVAVAEALRSEPLQPLTYPIPVPSWRRRTVYARFRTVGAAAAVAAMALGIAARAPLPSDARQDGFRAPNVAASALDDRTEQDEMRDLRRDQILNAGPVLAATSSVRHFGDQSA